MAHKDDSAPIRMLQLVWDNASKATGDSWRRLNESLQTALRLSIRCGMKFRPGDFTVIEERYRPEYWMGLGSDGGEGWFSSAVVHDNVTAAVAFEKWKDRPPFLWRGIEQERGRSFDGTRRLFVGAWFRWKGERVSVTKFSADGKSVRACSYVQQKGQVGSHWERSKVLHRHIITREELLAVRKAEDQANKLSKIIASANDKRLGDRNYLQAILEHAVGRERVVRLRAEGAVLAFWRSDADGKPCNSGTGGPRAVGMVEELEGPLVPCTKDALHATLRPEEWKGQRLWAVALFPPIEKVDEYKIASLKREILAEIKEFPAYEELIGAAGASR